MIYCKFCSNNAVVDLRYSRLELCKNHFTNLIDRRVKKEFRKQINLDNIYHIAVAVSGGKDSMTLLYLLIKFLGKRKALKFSIITIDEGIAGYRDKTLKAIEQFLNKHQLDWTIAGFKAQLNTTMDELSTKQRSSSLCTYCGVYRRFLLNKIARDINAEVLAVGLNLDDIVQSMLMNLGHNDLERIARLVPHKKKQPGFIPRIAPLRSVPEREILMYALLNEIPFSHVMCPYAHEAQRNIYRKILDDIESNSPGTKFMFLNSTVELIDILSERYAPAQLRNCELCGEMTIKPRCQKCELLKGER